MELHLTRAYYPTGTNGMLFTTAHSFTLPLICPGSTTSQKIILYTGGKVSIVHQVQPEAHNPFEESVKG